MKKLLLFNENSVFQQRFSRTIMALNLSIDCFYNEPKEQFYDYIILNDKIHQSDKSLNCSYCLLNMDNFSDKSIHANVYGNLITYGFGNKNTVTISSVESENTGFVYCLQRNLNNNSLGMCEAEEIPVNTTFQEEGELYSDMACITIGLIEGLGVEDLKEKLLFKNKIISN